MAQARHAVADHRRDADDHRRGEQHEQRVAPPCGARAGHAAEREQRQQRSTATTPACSTRAGGPRRTSPGGAAARGPTRAASARRRRTGQRETWSRGVVDRPRAARSPPARPRCRRGAWRCSGCPSRRCRRREYVSGQLAPAITVESFVEIGTNAPNTIALRIVHGASASAQPSRREQCRAAASAARRATPPARPGAGRAAAPRSASAPRARSPRRRPARPTRRG